MKGVQLFIALENENKDGEYIIKLENTEKVKYREQFSFSQPPELLSQFKATPIYTTLLSFQCDSSSLGPLDLEFEAVLFFIWAWLYLQRENVKWAETLAQDVRGVNVQ